jgi:hypothetical protein
LAGKAPGRITQFTKDVVWAALVDLVGKALGALIVALGSAATLGVVLLVIRGGSVPAWLTVLLIGIPAAGCLLLGVRLRRARAATASRDERIRELEPLEQEVEELRDRANTFDWGLERHEVYGEHISHILGHLQRVISGDIPGVSIPDFIERGILAPARDTLARHPSDDVRLSVLLPLGDEFRMVWAAGHDLESQKKYCQPISETLSRFTYENGVSQIWEDVEDDPHFKKNPHATRPFRSMVSLPIRVGDSVKGVFNTISGDVNAFDTADINYLISLGSVIDVAVSIYREQERASGRGKSGSV